MIGIRAMVMAESREPISAKPSPRQIYVAKATFRMGSRDYHGMACYFAIEGCNWFCVEVLVT